MKVKLPIIGLVQTGKDAEVKSDPTVKRAVNKGMEVLGGLIDFGVSKLSGEKTISAKLLQANKEWVYINNDVIAKEVSKIEFELFEVGLSKGEIVYREIQEHPLLDLLDKFNSTTTKTDGIYVTQSHKKLTGDAFWYLDKNGKSIENIFVLQPDKIELDLGDPTDGNSNLVEGYTYKDVIDGKEIKRKYDREDILHFKTPNPSNMFRGYGAVEAAADVIDIDNLTNYVSKKFFQNGAITNFVLTTDAKITDEQLKRVKAELQAAYAGPKNAWKAMILGGGLKPESISQSNKDMEFLAQLEWYRDKIMSIFGNTKASLGIIDDVNRASHENSMIEWKRTTVKPDMDAIVNTLNEFLVPMYGSTLVLGYKDPIEEDLSGDVDLATSLYSGKIISLNEAREMINLERVDGGDDVNSNPEVFSPQDEKSKIPASLKHLNVKQILRKRNMFTKLKSNQEIKEAIKPVLKGMKKPKTKTEDRIHAQFSNEQVQKYYEKQIRIVEVMEGRFEKAVEGMVKGFAEKAIDTFTGDPIDNFIDIEQAKQESQIALTPILLQMATLSGQQSYDLIKRLQKGLDDAYIPYDIEKQIRKNVDKFTESMIATDSDTLSKIIAEGIEAGQSVPQIESRIRDVFEEYSQMQSKRITRTEVIRVSNMAAEDAFKQSGVVEAKQWLVAPNADADCQRYSGDIVKLSGNFYQSENEFQDGNPPIHPNCRCVLLPIVVGAKAYQQPFDREHLIDTIKELEEKIDKRTKAYKDLKKKSNEKSINDEAYIKSLEALL